MIFKCGKPCSPARILGKWNLNLMTINIRNDYSLFVKMSTKFQIFALKFLKTNLEGKKMKNKMGFLLELTKFR
jgi:cell division FtsZ-interacting protein ZapD